MSNSTISTNQASLPDNSTLEAIFSLAVAEDLSGMLHRALKMLVKVFRAKGGSLFFFNRSTQRVAIGNLPQTVSARITQLEDAVFTRLQTGTWRILEVDALPVSLQDFAEENLRLINTPLLKQTKVLGSLSLALPIDPPLTAEAQATLNQFSLGIGQLAASIADTAHAQKRYRELDLIYQVGQALANTLDISELLETVMRLSANMLNAAASSIMLIDEARRELVFEVSHSPKAALLNRFRITMDEGIAGWVATHGRPALVNNVHADPRFSRNVDVRTGFLTMSIAAVPLRLKGKVIGVLEVLNKYSEGGFEDDDLRLMTSIAAQTAIALENARLYQSVRQEREKIINAQEEVRKELSRILHDGVVQQISAISMNLEYAQKLLNRDLTAADKELSSIQKLAHKTAKDARLVLFELRPVILETQGLIPALERYIAQLQENEDFHIKATLNPPPARLDKNVAGTIFSIIQEAINNIKRHARASQIQLNVFATEQMLVVQIKDNGTGFNVEETQKNYANHGSFGLLNMMERTELINGALTIDSKTEGLDHGTAVTLTVPLDRNDK
ncbi:MAG TPA: GAF domain-containing protein [Anaerolineae bacterium]|nr:GAF domain-containing protein [Anaerolineae bacterium]